jgi:hypothetical protein
MLYFRLGKDLNQYMSADTEVIEPPYSELLVQWCERSTNQIMVSRPTRFLIRMV